MMIKVLKKAFAVLTAVILAVGICGCNEKSEESTDTEHASLKKELRNSHSLMNLDSEADYEIDASDFLKSGEIKETLLLDRDGVKLTAEKITYLDNHAEINMTLENSNSYEICLTPLHYAVNGVDTVGVVYFYAGAGAKEDLVFSYDYDYMYNFGVRSLKSLQFSFIAYETDGKDENDFPNIKNVLSDCSDEYWLSELLVTENYTEGEYLLTDPRMEMLKSGFDSKYFLQETIGVAEDIFDTEDYAVYSASYGQVTNDDDYLFQISFCNKKDVSVIAEIENYAINGLSIPTRTISSTNYVLPNSFNVMNDFTFSNYFDSSHYEVFNINKVRSIAFDLVVYDADKSKEYGKRERITVGFEEPENGEFNFVGDKVYDDDMIQILCMDVYEDKAKYNGDLCVILALQNKTDDDISFSVPVKSFSDKVQFLKINGEDAAGMINIKDKPLVIPPEGKGAYLIDIDMQELAAKGISGKNFIKSISFNAEIRDYLQLLKSQPEIAIEF